MNNDFYNQNPNPPFKEVMYEDEFELIPEFEMILKEKIQSSFYTGNMSREYEYENGGVPPAVKPKTIWRHNTDLKAPCFAGNFNFLYNGGSNEATATFNTVISFRKNFTPQEKTNFINNLKQAADVWDNAAELQIKDIRGNYSYKIRLRFKLNIVNDSKNANKVTDVHPLGSRALPLIIAKDREVVSRQLNVFINSTKYVLVHELGHVWGLDDEYKDTGVSGWLAMKFSPCHVGKNSPVVSDKIAIMNEGYSNTGEFRTRYFKHFGRAILGAFWNVPEFVIPITQNGRVLAKTIQGRIALLKKNISGTAPYSTDMPPFNPQFAIIQIAKR